MNTTKTVFNKLYSKKTELESQKIELAAPNPKRLEKTAFEAYSTSNKFANKVTNTIVNNYKDTVKNINKIQDIHSEEYKDLQKKAEDLGIDIKSTKIGKDYLEVGTMLDRYAKEALNQQVKYASIKP